MIRDDGATVMLDGGRRLWTGSRCEGNGVGRRAGQSPRGWRPLPCEREPIWERWPTTRCRRPKPVASPWQCRMDRPSYPPTAGRSGIFSTNPFSWAVPAGEEMPVVYDIATTAVAGNKILLAKKRGDPTIPEGWANDVHGRPTTDTETASAQNLCWFGGYKGFGIALLVEVLSGDSALVAVSATPSRPNASWSATADWPRVGCS